ncbi:MAG: hypothetical protein HRU19_32610 [Pseudobacteriovorax sp.]|nr:hypothetical protein [Pseudobacteriovorax sp.]
MKFTLDKRMQERVENIALEMGISVSDVLTRSLDSYINVQLLRKNGYRIITAESDQKKGDISSWFYDGPRLIRTENDSKEEEKSVQRNQKAPNRW